MKLKRRILILTIVFIAAQALVLYPFFANIYNYRLSQSLITEYEEIVTEIDDSEYEQMIEEAQAWNAELYTWIEPSYFPDGMTNEEIYESLLNYSGNGMMGYVVIPKIDVSLPIFHYTTDEVLEKGAGHMQASALPVGGENTHCVITAHRGLPGATMFTDLDELEIGDVFYLKVLGQTYAYEVCEIQEVDPDETSSLLPELGRDLCTLVTCTPYGVNTQRLLVTGERIDYEEDDEVSTTSAIVSAFKADYLLLIVSACELIFYIVLIVYFIKTSKKQIIR